MYHFEDLLSLSPESTDSSPPLIFVHMPKTGGTTIISVLMRNFSSRLDSYGNDFFPRYYPDEFLSLVHPQVPDDTRRPVFFTGHIDIANDISRYMPVPYLAITILRDPVSRIVSQYGAVGKPEDSDFLRLPCLILSSHETNENLAYTLTIKALLSSSAVNR